MVRIRMDPKVALMAFLRCLSFKTPPTPLPLVAEGARFFQKREWLIVLIDRIKLKCRFI